MEIGARNMFRSAATSLCSSATIGNWLFLIVAMTGTLLGNTSVQAEDVNANTVTPPRAPPLLQETNGTVVKIMATQETICPGTVPQTGLALLFSIPCKAHEECSFLGTGQRCCKGYCRKGVLLPPKEPKHEAVLGFGRMCPKEPVQEFLPVRQCRADSDCEGGRRICCPDPKDLQLYCRTAAPVWSQLPFQRTHAPLMSLMGYMQCQAAPPPVLDLFPQPCNGTVDCFPNLCCQEGSKKICRPPKKSLIALVAQATQRFARG